MPTIQNILVPVDLSEGSAAAFRYAQTLAAPCGSTVCALYILENPHLTPGGGQLWEFSLPDLVRKLEEAGRQRLEEFVADLRDPHVTVETLSRVGQPATEITRCARDLQTDLIVIGTHGRGGVAHALLGSVAERVMRTAPCPVVTVRGSV